MKTFVFLVLTEWFAIGNNFERIVTHAYVSEPITLKCPLLSQNFSDVQWIYLDSQTVYSIGIDINPKIKNRTESTKFKIVGNHDFGEYNLKIINIEIEDKGVYRCDTEINGKPESRFIHLIVDDYQTDNALQENTTMTTEANIQTTKGIFKSTAKKQGFSMYTWILIFILSILGICILSVISAGVVKKMRSYPQLKVTDNDMNVEMENEFMYETINDSEISNVQESALVSSDMNVLRPQMRVIQTEMSLAHSSSTSVQSLFNVKEATVGIPDSICGNTNLNNENNNSDTSSTRSLGTSATSTGQIYEPPYINHYHPLGMRLERLSHVYDEC